MRDCADCRQPFDPRKTTGLRCGRCSRASLEVQREARWLVRKEIESGRLPALRGGNVLCVDCGAPAQGYDHRDYMRPLVVEPVCRKCNRRRGPAAPYPHAHLTNSKAA